MRGKSARIVVVGLLILLAVVAAVLFVMQEPPGSGDGAETPDSQPATIEDDEAATGGRGRKRARPAGSARVFGTVARGSERAPAAGVSVRLLDALATERVAETDETGAFSFANVAPGGPYEVTVREDGSAEVRVPGIALDRNEERDVGELVLAPAVPVDVLVRTMGDVAIASATVEAFAVQASGFGFDWQARMAQIGVAPVVIATATTNAEGRASFTGLASGNWTFRARKPGFATRGKNGVQLRSDRAANDITVHLPKGWTVSGTVREDGGEVLSNVLVMGIPRNMAWTPNHAPLNARATTDAEGAFTLEGLRTGRVGIWIGLPGGVPSLVLSIDVPRVPHIDIDLTRGGTLTGLVSLEADKSPVPGVVVRASAYKNGSSYIAEAVTDADGRYTIDTLMEGVVTQVKVDYPGHVVVIDGSPWIQVPLLRGDTVTHDVVLRRAATVIGTVTGPDGPLGGAKLTLFTMGTAGNWGQKYVTAESDGTYRADGIDAGGALVQVRARGHFQRDFPTNWWTALQQKNAPEEWFLEVPKEGEVTKDFVLEKGTWVSGLISDANGDPVAGALVRSYAATDWVEALSGEDGTYRMEGLALDKDINLNATADGHGVGSTQVKLDGPNENVDIQLTVQNRLRGVVLGDGPLEDAYVQLGAPQPKQRSFNQPQQQDQWGRLERLPVREDGTFDVPLPSWDPIVVRAVATGYGPTEVEVAKSTAGDTEVEVRLKPGAIVRGVVSSKGDGAPIANALIVAGPGRKISGQNMAWQLQQMEQQNPRPVVAVTDGNGLYEITHLGPGGHNITARAAAFVELLQHVVVKDEHDVGFGLEPALAIAGVVKFTDGEPVGGARVTMRAAGATNYGPNQEVRSSSDGRFRKDGLKAGKYTVTLDPPWNGDVNVTSTTVKDVEAGTEDLEIVAQHGLTITGRLVDDAGEPVPAISISGQPPQNNPTGVTTWRQARSGEDGTFEMVGLQDGTWTLNVGAQSGYAAFVKAGVPAGARDVILRMTKGLELSGVLVDENGDGVSGKMLLAQRLDLPEGTQSSWLNATTASGGKFKFNGLEVADYSIIMQGNDQTVISGGARVSAGQSNIRLEYSKGLTITGALVTTDDGSAEGAWVLALPNGKEGVGQKHGRVTADGTFTIEGTQPDISYTLRTMGGNYRAAEVEGIEAGASNVSITVEPGLRVSGTFVDASGKGLTNAMLSFEAVEGKSRTSGRTAEAGTFSIGGLDEGVYKVTGWVQEAEGEQWTKVELGEVTAGETGVEFRAPD